MWRCTTWILRRESQGSLHMVHLIDHFVVSSKAFQRYRDTEQTLGRIESFFLELEKVGHRYLFMQHVFHFIVPSRNTPPSQQDLHPYCPQYRSQYQHPKSPLYREPLSHHPRNPLSSLPPKICSFFPPTLQSHRSLPTSCPSPSVLPTFL
jgi:hypothetical protein